MQRATVCFLLIVSLLAGCERNSGPEPVDDPSVIILMYHRITSGDAANLYERIAADFERDLRYLHDNN
ncbi:MAG: hypothetical protein ABR560_04940, partial [Bacteroidales bacterium]